MNLKQQILSRCDNTSDLLNNLSCSELDNSFFKKNKYIYK